MAIHESGQMYLETIYILSQNSTFVRAIDVGAQLGFTKPSVSRAMSILKKDGYVNVDADGAITLTESGLAIAKTMYTRHTVLSQMLMELGVDEETATEDACRIEHVISEKSFAAVQAHLEQVTKMRKMRTGNEAMQIWRTLLSSGNAISEYLPFGTGYQMRWSLDMASTAFYVICAFKSGATCCVSSPPSVPAP